MQLAEANIARMRYPVSDPRMQPFLDGLAEINAAAEMHPGFVWRLQTDYGNALDVRAFDDDRIIFNLSVWSGITDLFRYTYRSGHGGFFSRRREWFEAPDKEPLVMWWVPDGHVPTVQEAVDRFERLWKEGASPAAFGFRTAFDERGRSLPEGWRKQASAAAST
jgi:hypothetical protein